MNHPLAITLALLIFFVTILLSLRVHACGALQQIVKKRDLRKSYLHWGEHWERLNSSDCVFWFYEAGARNSKITITKSALATSIELPLLE